MLQGSSFCPVFSHSFTLHLSSFLKLCLKRGGAKGSLPMAGTIPQPPRMQSWYPVAGTKLVTTLRKTGSGLPEDKCKVTLLLLAAFCPAQCGTDSECDGEVLGVAQHRCRSSSPHKSILSQKIGTMVTSRLLSLVFCACALLSQTKKVFSP